MLYKFIFIGFFFLMIFHDLNSMKNQCFVSGIRNKENKEFPSVGQFLRQGADRCSQGIDPLPSYVKKKCLYYHWWGGEK